MNKVIIAKELDIFFMSYGEPDAESNFRKCKSLFPKVTHVKGIKGFDAVHRKCGELSSTDFLITVDADTIIHSSFASLKMIIKPNEPDNLCFYSRNIVNNLTYGNGGIKIWAKDFASNMAFHELGSGLDFCWDPRYRSIPKIYSDTKINGSPIQAFRAGYREGIKLTTNKGRRIDPKDWSSIHEVCKKGLSIWTTIGADVENGSFAMHGALLGIYHHLNDIDNSLVSDFDYHESLLKEEEKYHENEDLLFNRLEFLRKEIINNSTLILPKAFYPEQSKFIKSLYKKGMIF